MAEPPITAGEFETRLAALCLSRKGSAFPRRSRDRHILLRSAAQSIDATKSYSELQLNGALRQWLADVAGGIALDHVALRRYLVDAGYLQRDPRGAAYRVHLPGKGEVEFEPDVTDVDSLAVVLSARERAAIRKQARSASNTPNAAGQP